ncbi:MAG: cell wall hydrolase [Alphaproteobacteria bacterium]
MFKTQQDQDIDTMAKTIWAEARGEGLTGMRAVGLVILNRYKISKKKGGYWWGNTITDICKKPYQFSCWNKDDANYKKIMNISLSDDYFVIAKRIASRIIRADKIDDITKGADHYHTTAVMPRWMDIQKQVNHIGNHIFYKLVN